MNRFRGEIGGGWGKSVVGNGNIVIGKHNRNGYSDGYGYIVDKSGDKYLGGVRGSRKDGLGE